MKYLAENSKKLFIAVHKYPEKNVRNTKREKAFRSRVFRGSQFLTFYLWQKPLPPILTVRRNLDGIAHIT
jgi:hypothetical protein